MMQQVNKPFQQGGMGHVKEWKGVQYSHHGYMHPRNAGGKRNSQPSTEGDLPEEGSCNEIGQGATLPGHQGLTGDFAEAAIPPIHLPLPPAGAWY